MDFLALPKIKQPSTGMKFDHHLVIVDRSSKYTICIAMPANHITTHVIHAYYQDMYPHFGLPEDIVSDQATIFTPIQWLQFCSVKGSGKRPTQDGDIPIPYKLVMRTSAY